MSRYPAKSEKFSHVFPVKRGFWFLVEIRWNPDQIGFHPVFLCLNRDALNVAQTLRPDQHLKGPFGNGCGILCLRRIGGFEFFVMDQLDAVLTTGQPRSPQHVAHVDVIGVGKNFPGETTVHMQLFAAH